MSQHTPRSSLTYVHQGVPFFSINKTTFSHLVQPSRNVVKVSQNHEFYFCSLKSCKVEILVFQLSPKAEMHNPIKQVDINKAVYMPTTID